MNYISSHHRQDRPYVAKGSYIWIGTLRPPSGGTRHSLATQDGDDSSRPLESQSSSTPTRHPPGRHTHYEQAVVN
eukprot:6174713-Pleurochrysis_carterae.AAC.2